MPRRSWTVQKIPKLACFDVWKYSAGVAPVHCTLKNNRGMEIYPMSRWEFLIFPLLWANTRKSLGLVLWASAAWLLFEAL